MRKRLLWIDGVAAAVGGVAVLALSGWLAGLYGLPRGLLLGTGSVNLLYACYSLTLASRSRRPLALVVLLVCANLGWSVVCLALAVAFAGSANGLGIGHLVGEAAFVAGLASLEWRFRALLATG